MTETDGEGIAASNLIGLLKEWPPDSRVTLEILSGTLAVRNQRGEVMGWIDLRKRRLLAENPRETPR